MTHRLAVYFAPDAGSALWRLGTSWLGGDPATGEALAQPAVAGLAGATAEPRRYGLHATLKPPMRLAAGRDEAGLRDALAAFAAAEAPVIAGPLAVADLAGFLALVPRDQPAALTDFAARVVEAFEPFRAPLTPEERAARLAGLTAPRHVELLDRFGYPYVMDEFRFHITLSGRLGTRTETLRAAAEAHFAAVLAAPLAVDRLSLYAEPAPGAPFRRLADFPLGGAA